MSEWVIIKRPDLIKVEDEADRTRQRIREMNAYLRGEREHLPHRRTCPIDHGWHG